MSVRELTDGSVLFENARHDFPQRVVYEKKGERLEGRIEGTDNGKARTETWSYRRAR